MNRAVFRLLKVCMFFLLIVMLIHSLNMLHVVYVDKQQLASNSSQELSETSFSSTNLEGYSDSWKLNFILQVTALLILPFMRMEISVASRQRSIDPHCNSNKLSIFRGRKLTKVPSGPPSAASSLPAPGRPLTHAAQGHP